MASIGGVSGSNTTSSLYNSANVISGLASGLDTEGMIENLVQSYQNKIQSINNKVTKLEWKQEAYRSIISKMYAFSNKYTSYTSSTNLMSTSFFNNAIKVAAQGKYADKVTASGRTDSDVKLNSVKQLATAARYTTSGSFNVGGGFDITAEKEQGIYFTDRVEMGTLSGSLSLSYGGKTVSVVFDSNTDMIDNDLSGESKAEALANMIRSKLANETVTLSSGESKPASDLIDINVTSAGQLTFRDKSSGGNEVYLSGASGTVGTVLGLDLTDAEKEKPNSIQVKDTTRFTQTPSVASLISGKSMNITLDDKTKTIYLPKVVDNYDGTYSIYEATPGKDKNGDAIISYTNPQKVSATEYADYYTELVRKSVSQEFGSKIQVKNLGIEKTDKDDPTKVISKSLKLSFEAPDNSNLLINSDAGKALGIGNTATNYLSTSKTLGELTNIKWDSMNIAKDADGNLMKDNNGDYLYEFVINGKVVGGYNANSKLSDLMNDINTSDAGVKVSYSQTTRNFSFASKETGVENTITMGRDGTRAGNDLAKALFGSTETLDKEALSAAKMSDILGAGVTVQGQNLGIGFQEGDEVIRIDYTINGTDPSVKNVLDAINSELAKKGTDVRASLSDDGKIVLKDKYGGEKKITQTSDLASRFIDGVSKKSGSYVSEAAGYTAGQDAIFQVTVNGQTMDMTRGSNSANIDGLTINFKATFEAEPGDEVTFQRTTDSDKIIDAIKSMITDYNEMMAEVRTQYATLPYQNSSGAFQTYEPLTDEDKATMSESAIQKYEEKAKQGLLFNDRDLSALYQKMNSIFTPGGSDQVLLSQMGIGISYASDGSSYITLDETKMRDMLDNDPDTVANLFTRSASTGASSDGIMQQMKTQLDRYGSTTGATKGILVEQAGTPLSSLTLMSNTWQKQIDNYNTEIEKWQDKLSAQVDKYTSMFSKLEVLINQMNSQSSTLAGLMGGY